MLVKIHSSYRDIVAICDTNLKGKIFKEGKFILDVREDFYNGEEKTKEQVVKILKNMIQQDATFIIVGNESIETVIELNIINQKNIKTIQGIPFILILK